MSEFIIHNTKGLEVPISDFPFALHCFLTVIHKTLGLTGSPTIIPYLKQDFGNPNILNSLFGAPEVLK